MNKQIFEGKKTPDFSFSPSPTREKSQPNLGQGFATHAKVCQRILT